MYRKNCCVLPRAGIAVATMKGKSYLQSAVYPWALQALFPNPDFFQEYLGMRNEYVDASEIERRVQLGIYDHEEFARAMAWTEKYCKSNEGTDFNPEHLVYSREEKMPLGIRGKNDSYFP